MTELSLLMKATVILGVTLVVVRISRRASASVRALLISSAFGVLLVLPLAAMLVPPREIAIPVSYAVEDDTFFADDLAAAAGDVPLGTDQPIPVTPTRWSLPSLPTLVRSAWAAGTLLLLMPIVVAPWRLRRIRRSGLPWTGGDTLLASLAGRGRTRRRVDVFLHEDLVAPMTCGLMRPAVGLPVDAPYWSERHLRHALVHELEHVRRGDWPLHLLARMVCAIYWFQPLVWIASRRLCLECERACDDAVLRCADRTVYAEQLLSLARRLSQRGPQAVLSMADRSDLSTRVRAVLDTHQARGRAGAVSTLAIVSTAIALALTISPLQAVSRLAQGAPQPESKPLAFEVASIRPSPPGATRDLGGCCSVRYLPGGRVTATNVGLLDLIVSAYRVQYWQISGGPGVNIADGTWMNPDMLSTKDRYNVEAIAGGDRSPDQTRLMLQTLLAERFQLAIRRETKAGKIYELVIDPRGHKLQPVTVDKYEGSKLRSGGGRLLVDEMTMPDLARHLQGQEQVQTTVIDRTGLTGVYAFNVVWTPQMFRLTGVGRPPENGEPGIDPNGPSMLDALREQAGLRLRESTGPVEHLIIERAERASANDAPQAPAGAPQGLGALIESPTTGPDAPRFEVASIKPHKNNGGPGGGALTATGQVRTTNSTLRFLIGMAYGLRMTDVVLGGPDWINTDGFDVDAKPEGAVTVARARLMLRTLLAERFKLVVRKEPREMPIYALTLARTDGRLGPQIQRPVGECVMMIPGFAQAGGQGATSLPGPATPGPQPPLGRPGRRCGMAPEGPATIKAGSTAMAGLITLLTPALDRPVVDKTGLTGTFDFDLRYAGARIGPGLLGRGRGAAVSAPDASNAPTDDAPSIFTALQEQLGLKLDAQRGPVDVLVVYQAEQPAEN